MNRKPLHLILAALPAAWVVICPAMAEQHTDQALRHINEALDSAGDSKAVAKHADEALKHIDAAKAAQSNNPEALKRLQKGEADLKDAEEKAGQYHGVTAVQDAEDAKAHLEGKHTHQ